MPFFTPYAITLDGVTPTFTTAVAGNSTAIPNDRTFLIVRNAAAGGRNVFVFVPGDYLGQARPDVAIPIPVAAGAVLGEKLIGPLNDALADPLTGLVTWTYGSLQGDLSIALVEIPAPTMRG